MNCKVAFLTLTDLRAHQWIGTVPTVTIARSSFYKRERVWMTFNVMTVPKLHIYKLINRCLIDGINHSSNGGIIITQAECTDWLHSRQ